MKINYKRELEDAARTMILVHKPQTLIKLIVRMIIKKVKVRHAGILLYDPKSESYVLTVSRGKVGFKIPPGFARVDRASALVRFFQHKENQQFLNGRVLEYDTVVKSLKNKRLLEKLKGMREILTAVKNQMELFDTLVCVPSYFRDKLLGILLLGGKSPRGRFYREELEFFTALGYDVAMAIRNAQLFEELQEQIERNRRLFLDTTKALATTIDAKDHYTHGHTERVTHFSLEITKKLIEEKRINVDDKFLDELNISALLHDIGKIGVPEYILNKKDKLTPDERRKINEHSLIGASILAPIHDLQRVIEGVKHHHERFDGSGYPEGLRGEDIPLISCIIGVADAFDAMTTNRPYRAALTKEQAIEEIKNCRGTQFHPLMADALIELYYERKI